MHEGEAPLSAEMRFAGGERARSRTSAEPARHPRVLRSSLARSSINAANPAQGERQDLATYNIKRFADPDALKRMQQPYLIALLRPFDVYFARRGLSLPAGDGAEVDHESLAGILLTPDDAGAGRACR